MSSISKKSAVMGVMAVCALGGLSATPAWARNHPTPIDDFEESLQMNGDQLARERSVFPAYFAEAYLRNPKLPDGVLEAVAFVGSRWEHRIPAAPFDGHHNMPQAYGIMGLYHGYGDFRDVVAEAAQALGVSEDAVIQSPRVNILATAALLTKYIDEAGLSNPFIEEMGPVLTRLSGIPNDSNGNRFARDSYFFDLLLTLDRGSDDWGIKIADRPIYWELAFDVNTLILMRAPMVRVDPERDMVSLPGAHIDPASETVVRDTGLDSGRGGNSSAERTSPESTDYAPALWVTSPNYSSRSSSITAVAIHTTQGSYSGTISWFQNTSSDVSAHYVVRSSDGQVTQMVREYNKAWHIGSENGYTLGTEHEGYVDTSSYYTTAMYNSSSNLTKDMCSSNKINCTTVYPGPASSGTSVQSSSYKIKGHQHYPNQTHTDPGKYWDWSRYKTLCSGSSSGGGSTGGGTTTSSSTVLDSFESGEGHFNTSPTYSGSTSGISTSSTADRTTGTHKNGSYGEKIYLVDNSSSTGSWSVRFLSGSGSASQNTGLAKSGGRVGFWVYTAGSGFTAAMGVDDGSNTEMSIKKSIPTNTWTYLEWKLDDASQWDPWYGSSTNGQIDSSTCTLDAIWFFHANTSYSSYIYIDDVTYKKS